jgi:hypothetical protein
MNTFKLKINCGRGSWWWEASSPPLPATTSYHSNLSPRGVSPLGVRLVAYPAGARCAGPESAVYRTPTKGKPPQNGLSNGFARCGVCMLHSSHEQLLQVSEL